MTSAIESSVGTAITALTSNNQVFSIHDVTSLVREDVGPNTNVKHDEVKDLFYSEHLADIIAKNNYCVTVGTIGTNSFNVFYPAGTDPTKYDPSNIKAFISSRKNAISAANVSKAATVNTVNTNTTGATKTAPKTTVVAVEVREINKDGRFSIPNDFTRKLGWKVGQTVFVHNSKTKNVLVIADQNWTTHNLVAELIVDQSGNIRISKESRKDTTVKNKSKFTVRLSNNHITVE